MIIKGLTEGSILPLSACPVAFTLARQVWRSRILFYRSYLLRRTPPSCFNKLGRFTCVPVLRCLWNSFCCLCWEDTERKSLYVLQVVQWRDFSQDTKTNRRERKGKKLHKESDPRVCRRTVAFMCKDWHRGARQTYVQQTHQHKVPKA